MKRRWLGEIVLGMTSFLGACAVPAQVPTSPPEATVRARPAGPYTVLDSRTYFHQHYDVPGEVSSDTVYVGDLKREITFTSPEQWQGISGYVWGNLGTFGPKSMWYIPSPYTGWIWGWNADTKKYQRYEAGYDGQALRYVPVRDQ
jgi:hypothetical protein